MNFSIIIPTRKRIPLLETLLKSITDKTSCSVEIIIICDNDDTETIEWLKGKEVKLLTRDRGSNLSADYYNWALPHVTGEYIWSLNDDVEIETDEWDKIALAGLKDHDIVMGNVQSNHYDYEGEISTFTYFPILSRKAVDKLGYIFPCGYAGWGADSVLWEVYQERIVDLTSIRVKHVTGRKLQDECYHNMKYWSENNTRGFNINLERSRLSQ